MLELELISRLAPDRNIEAVTAREDWNGKGKKMQRRIDRRLVSCSPLIAPAGSSLDLTAGSSFGFFRQHGTLVSPAGSIIKHEHEKGNAVRFLPDGFIGDPQGFNLQVISCSLLLQDFFSPAGSSLDR